MNLIEALRTGKNLRRPVDRHLGPSGNDFLFNKFVLRLLTHNNDYMCQGDPKNQGRKMLTAEDILALDWEIEPDDKTDG